MSEITFEPGRLSVPARSRSRSEVSHDDSLVRLMDLTIVVLALLFLLPLFVVIALAIVAQDGGPIFFAHRRIGRPSHERNGRGIIRSDPIPA